MSICKYCGANIEEENLYCSNCGHKIGGQDADIPPFPETPQSSISTPPPFMGELNNPPIPDPIHPKSKSKVWKILLYVGLAIVVVLGIIFTAVYFISNSTTYMTFNSSGELFTKGGGSSLVNIDYDGRSWEVTYKPSWISIDKYNKSFNIRCEPNTTGEDRKDHITIKSGKIVLMLPVSQLATTQFIQLSEDSITCDKTGDRIDIQMETDATNPEFSYPDFCSIENQTPTGFTVVIPYNTGYSRSGRIDIEEDGVSASVYVNQQGECRNCDGRGSVPCLSCGGSGSVGFGYFMTNCYNCGGSGSLTCGTCGGDGID